MKKFFCLFACLALVCPLSFPAFAAETAPQDTVTYIEYLDDGITVVTTIQWQNASARSSRTGRTSQTYYNNGAQIATVYLDASFYYDGSTSYVTATRGSASTASGWTYSGQSTWGSGRTAYLQASLSNGSKTVPVSLSLTCDANGNLS